MNKGNDVVIEGARTRKVFIGVACHWRKYGSRHLIVGVHVHGKVEVIHRREIFRLSRRCKRQLRNETTL